MKNYVYVDINTNKIKTATHAVFDEAHYSQPSKPRGAQILMGHGYISHIDKPPSPINTRPTIKVVVASSTNLNSSNNLIVAPTTPDAIIPRQATDKAAGYDLYSVTSAQIAPNSLVKFDTGTNGFGSTGRNILFNQSPNNPSIHALQSCDLTMSMHAPLDLLDVSISTNHPHETLGLVFNQHMILLSCTPGTPAAKLKGWRQTLKGTRLIRVNGKEVSTKAHVIKHIDRSTTTNTLQFASHFQTPIHPETGTTQIILLTNLSPLHNIIRTYEQTHKPLMNTIGITLR